MSTSRQKPLPRGRLIASAEVCIYHVFFCIQLSAHSQLSTVLNLIKDKLVTWLLQCVIDFSLNRLFLITDTDERQLRTYFSRSPAEYVKCLLFLFRSREASIDTCWLQTSVEQFCYCGCCGSQSHVCTMASSCRSRRYWKGVEFVQVKIVFIFCLDVVSKLCGVNL